MDDERLVGGSDPMATIAVVRRLSWLRSAVLIGQALAAKYPTEEQWIAYTQSPAFLRDVEEVAVVMRDIATAMADRGDLLDVEALQLAVEQHYGRALDAVETLSTTWGIHGADLLNILLNE